MESRPVRDARILLPAFETDLLDSVDSLEDGVAEFIHANVEVRELGLNFASLRNGLVKSVRAQGLSFHDVSLDSVVFQRCFFGSIEIDHCRLSRVSFVDCQLNGLRLSKTKLSDVIFERCRLDYALMQEVRTARSAAFLECSMREVSLLDCEFEKAVIDGCRLDGLELERGKFSGCDLRGNDLSTVRGIAALRKARIAEAQVPQLAEAMVRELELDVEDA